MYDPGPSDDELKAIGLLREDVTDTSDFQLSTQWRVGYSGPTGLDYTAVEWVMSLMKVKKKREVFRAIRIMESSALSQMSKS